MSPARVVVVGSFAVGLTLRAPRFPVAGETLLAYDFDQGPGGKGSNQAVQASRMGAEVEFVGVVGADAFGDMGRALWADEGVGTEWLRVTEDVSTGVGFIMLDDTGENRILLDPGANNLLSDDDVAAAAPVISRADVMLTQLEVPVPAAAAALGIAREAGVTTVLNPAPARQLPDWKQLRADVVTPNASEACSMLGLDPDAEVGLEELSRGVVELGFATAVVTGGERGSVTVSNGSVRPRAAWPTRVVDSTGAGDAFSGTLAAALAVGSPVEDAVDAASIAGALACTRLGVIPSLPRAADVVTAREADGD